MAALALEPGFSLEEFFRTAFEAPAIEKLQSREHFVVTEVTVVTDSFELEGDFMAVQAGSRMDTFLLHTLPLMCVVVVTVLGAAWALYTRLDDGISEARKEVKADLIQVDARLQGQFERLASKVDSMDARSDAKTSSILQQITDLRVRQTQSEQR